MAIEHSVSGVMLTTARTDTAASRAVFYASDMFLFFDKRLRFVGEKDSALFPSMLGVWLSPQDRERYKQIAGELSSLGTVILTDGVY